MPPAVQELINEANQLHAANRTFSVTSPDAGQCTAIPHRLEQLTGNPIVYGNAKDTFANAPDAYTKEANTPSGVPKPGAIVVWNGSWGGGYGHTAVAVDGCTTSVLRVLEENDGDNGLPHVGQHNYSGVIGWFTPKNLEAGRSLEVDKPNADNEGVVNGQGLRGHTQPSSTSPNPWSFDDNEHITLVAKTQAENVTTGPYAPSSWWYLAHGNDDNAKNAGFPQVWVSDAFVRTTHNPANVPDYQQPVEAAPGNSPLPSKPLVLDISSVGQPNGVDFDALKAYGVEGVIIRAGHVGESFGGGQDDSDPKFHEYALAAIQAGLQVGYYWYGYPSLSPEDEAQSFVNTIGKLAPGEPLFLDIEEDDDHVKDWIAKFVAKVEKLTNRACWVYSYTSFITKYNLDKSGVAWEANFNGDSTDSSGLVTQARLHQYSDAGIIPGVKGKVDLSVLQGSLTDLAIDYPTTMQPVTVSTDNGGNKVPEVSLPVQPAIKPGIKTSEFWINLLVQVVAIGQALNVQNPVIVKGIALLAAVLSAYGYTQARASVKAAQQV